MLNLQWLNPFKDLHSSSLRHRTPGTVRGANSDSHGVAEWHHRSINRRTIASIASAAGWFSAKNSTLRAIAADYGLDFGVLGNETIPLSVRCFRRTPYLLGHFYLHLRRWVLLAPFGLVLLYGISTWLRADVQRFARTQRISTGTRIDQKPVGYIQEFSIPGELCDSAEMRGACAAKGSACQQIFPVRLAQIIHPPFVILGNISAYELDGWYHRAIAPAALSIVHTYQQKVPTRPIQILLLRDESSYRLAVERLFGKRQVSVYGFYHPREQTMVVNLGGGGGTLLHELTHAMTGEDFPTMPLWFNEGLASMHEACDVLMDASGASIRPQENWRGRVLEQAQAAGDFPSIEHLVTESSFSGPSEGLDYALSRYWCFYLSEQGMLAELYRQMRSGGSADPQGILAVRKMLPGKSWHQIDMDFQAWVRTRHGHAVDSCSTQRRRTLHDD